MSDRSKAVHQRDLRVGHNLRSTWVRLAATELNRITFLGVHLNL